MARVPDRLDKLEKRVSTLEDNLELIVRLLRAIVMRPWRRWKWPRSWWKERCERSWVRMLMRRDRYIPPAPKNQP